MRTQIAKVTKNIKENPLPYITAAAGAAVGASIAYKRGAASTVTVGKWHQKLEQDGFDVLIVPRALADKIVPSVPRR